MERKYIYKDERYGEQEFTVSKPDDCSMKVTKDGCSVTISGNEFSERFLVEFSPTESPRKPAKDADEALDLACRMILRKLSPEPIKEELCFQLDSLYDKLR